MPVNKDVILNDAGLPVPKTKVSNMKPVLNEAGLPVPSSKKKDGGNVSSQISSDGDGATQVGLATPEVTSTIPRHEGDYLHPINSLIDQYGPTPDPVEGSIAHDQFKNSVLNGDPESIKALQDNAVSSLEKQKNKIISDDYNPDLMHSLMQNNPQHKQMIDDLDKSIETVKKDVANYATIATVNKHLNTVLSEGSDTGMDSGMISREVGKSLEQSQLPANDFNKRESVYQSGKTLDDLEQKVIEGKEKFPMLANHFDQVLKDAKQKTPYVVENINYDRELSGNQAIIGVLGLKINQAKEAGDIDQVNKLTATKDQFEKEQDGLLDKYPDVGISMAAKVISDRLSKGNFIRFKSQDDIEQAAAAEAKEHPEAWSKLSKYVKYVTPTMLPKGGFIENVSLGVEGVGQRWFGDNSDLSEVSRSYNPGLTTTKYSGINPTKIAYDTDSKAYRELPNENYGTIDFNSTVAHLGQSVAPLAEFVLLEKGAGGLGGLVTNMGVRGVTKLAQVASKLSENPITAEELASTRQALEATKSLKETIGLTVPMYVQSYNQNRQIAEEMIGGDSGQDDFKKGVLANALTLMSVAAFRIAGYSPNKIIQSSLTRQLVPDALKIIEKEGIEGLSKPEIAEGFFKDQVIPKVMAIGKKLGVPIKQGVGAVVLDQNARGLLNSIVNPTKGRLPSLSEDADAIIQQVIMMTALGLPGAVSAKTTGQLTKDAWWESGLRRPHFESIINEGINDGTYQAKEGNEMISAIRTMEQEVNKAASATTDNGLPLTVKQKKDLAFNNFKLRAAEMLAEKGHDVGVGSVKSQVDDENKIIQSTPKYQELPIDEDGIPKTKDLIDKEWRESIALAKTPKEKADINKRHAEETTALGPTGEKVYSDFDGTLFKDGELTPLGETLKGRDDITVLTAREDTEANRRFIADRLGIPVENVQAGLTPERKAAVLDLEKGNKVFYDDNPANIEAAKGTDARVVDTGEAAPEPTKLQKAADLLKSTIADGKAKSFAMQMGENGEHASEVLKQISQQAQGYFSDWSKSGPGREKDLIDQGIPQELIDAAKTTFPVPEKGVLEPRSPETTDRILKQELPMRSKFRSVSITDLTTGAKEDILAYRAKNKLEKQHSLLDDILNCLTK